MPEFFMKYQGEVLSTTFDKYCYVSLRHLPPFFEYKTELAYSRMERVASAKEIQHPAIRHGMEMTGTEDIRLTYEADLPARSGLGTSSSFAVGMLNGFHAMKGEHPGCRQLADEAIDLERNRCLESGGWQDQIAAAFGGFNRIVFSERGYTVFPVHILPERKEELNRNLMMFFTGFTRFSSDIQKANQAGAEDKTPVLKEMVSMVKPAVQLLEDPVANLNEFGRMLDHTWQLKRRSGSAVSTDGIDALYQKGMDAGALGGKLLGAGGGGFLVFYVEPDRQKDVMKALDGLMYVPFEFENGGSRVIFESD